MAGLIQGPLAKRIPVLLPGGAVPYVRATGSIIVLVFISCSLMAEGGVVQLVSLQRGHFPFHSATTVGSPQHCSSPKRAWTSQALFSEPGHVDMSGYDNGICRKMVRLVNQGMIENFGHPSCDWMFRLKPPATREKDPLIVPEWHFFAKAGAFKPGQAPIYRSTLPWRTLNWGGKQAPTQIWLYFASCNKRYNTGPNVSYVVGSLKNYQYGGIGYPVSYREENYTIEFNMHYEHSPYSIIVSSPFGSVCELKPR
jgi:hypothetical protein